MNQRYIGFLGARYLRAWLCGACCLCWLGAARLAHGDEAAPAPPAAPSAAPASVAYAAVDALWKKYCLGCHGAAEPEGGLSLVRHETLFAGGRHGAVIAPGRSGESRLLRLLRGEDEPRMPPADNEAPTAEELATIAAWIDAGAPGPAGAAADPTLLVTPRIAPRGAVRASYHAVAWSPNGQWLAWAGTAGVRVEAAEDHRLVFRTEDVRGPATDVRFAPAQPWLLVAAGEPGLFGEATLWDLESGRQVRRFVGHRDSLYAAALSPDGQRLATASYDQQVLLWDTHSGQVLSTIEGHSGAVFDVAFSPDGRLLATASADRTVKLWDVATGNRLDTLGQALKETYTLAFSPDGRRLLAGGADNRLRLWELSATAAEGTNRLLVTRFAHQGALLHAAFAASAPLVASSADDGSVRLWNAAELSELRSLEAQPDWPTALALSPDGSRLAVGRQDGSRTVYQTSDGKPIPTAAPVLSASEPPGAQRGGRTRLRLVGQALAEVQAVECPTAGVELAWEVQPAGSAGELWVDLHVAAEVTADELELRVRTAGGASGPTKLALDDLPQVAETALASVAQGTRQATTGTGIWGALAVAGELDRYRFEGRAGQTLVAELTAQSLGSKLDGVLALYDPRGRLLRTVNDYEGQTDPLLVAVLPEAGTYTLEAGDLTLGGSAEHRYRLSLGEFAYVTGVFPPSVPPGVEGDLELAGVNLPPAATARVAAPAAGAGPATGMVAVPLDRSCYRLRRPVNVVVSDAAQQSEIEPNDAPEQATALNLPAVAVGRVEARDAAPDADLYRFTARAGEVWIVETDAARRGWPVDTRIEVLDAGGKSLPRLRLAAVRDSAITFRGINSVSADVRLTNWEEMELNQWVYFQGEVGKLFRLPQGPDSGFLLYTWQGNRLAYFDTSPTTHPVDEPAYIVEPLALNAAPPANGLPVFTLYYVNDDDGQRRLGRDSRLTFTAPADGDYLVRVSDVRGAGGPQFGYRLLVRKPQPGFEVSVGGRSPTVHTGGGRGISFTADRQDGFDGEIRIDITGMPEGLQVSTPVIIPAGQTAAASVVYAPPGSTQPPDEAFAKVEVTATAEINGATVRKSLGDLGTVRLSPAAKLLVRLEPPEVAIQPGQTITARLRIERQGFQGPVSFEVANLPHGVYVDNIGLNGVLIPEEQSDREIFFTARPWVTATARAAYAVATNAGGEASAAITLRVVPAAELAQSPATP